MARFYVNTPLGVGQQLRLAQDLVRHVHVLRLRENEEIILFNGDGVAYAATLLSITKRDAEVMVTKEQYKYQVRPVKIILAMASINNDKMDLVVQKATELGVNEIVPVISERAKRIDADKLNKRLEHWQSIVINSCEQCGSYLLPKVSTPVLFQELFIKYNATLKLILSPKAKVQPSLTTLMPQDVILLVGPEGGFSDAEVNQAILSGYTSFSLGENILRAETAAIAGVSVVNTLYNNWK